MNGKNFPLNVETQCIASLQFAAAFALFALFAFLLPAGAAAATKYTPDQLHFEKEYQVRNFFNLSVPLNRLDFTEDLMNSAQYPRINVEGSLDFNQSGEILRIENTGNTRAESYLKMGKLYHYAAIDMDVVSQSHAGYTANAILSLHKDAQNRILIVQRDSDADTKTFSVEIFRNGASVFAQNLSSEGIAAPYTIRIHLTGRYLSFFRVKDEVSAYLATIDAGTYFDLRDDNIIKDFSIALGARLNPAESVSFSGLSQYLSSGTGQADPRVLHYEDGAPIIVDNKIWLAMTTRGYDPIPSSHQGIYCYDLASKEWQLTGDMSFDNGDGLKRPWHATDVFFDRNDRQWKFLTVSHGDDHKIYSGACDKDPRFGITENTARVLDCGISQGEDPSIIYDADAKKWRLAMCRDAGGGFNTVLLESAEWDGAYTLIAENSAVSSTGILLQKVGGEYFVFQGRGNANYEILSYPDLTKRDVLKVSPLLTDRNIWPVIIPVTSEAGTVYHLLTFDREQVTGTYSYGNLHWYRATEEATGFFEYNPDSSALIDNRPAVIKHRKVFPNPAGKFLHVEGLAKPATATVRNLTGQIMAQKETSGVVDVGSLTPNIYFIDFGDGKTIKFIKSNHEE
ncbi:MAG: T9SS type A sorting domain-containing protein [Tannerella sp.]|nr:T9SS type A sorting domain-containing protein [Tannerella sp.]